MSTYAQMAHDKRNEAIAAGQALFDLAVNEKRDLNPEELEQVDRAEADAKRWAAESERALRMEGYAAQAAEFRGITQRVETSGSEDEKRVTEIDLFLRGIQAAKDGKFAAYGMDDNGNVTPEFRAISVGSEGDHVVDKSFSTQLTEYLRDETPMLGAPVTLIPTQRGEPFTWPRLTADPTTGGTITPEAGVINEGDPTISSVTFGAFKYGWINPFSSEVDEDNVIGLQGVLARSTARQLGLDAGTHLTAGTGTVQPTGIVTAAVAGHTATGTASTGLPSDTFFSWMDLIDLFGSVASGYRNRSTSGWMVSNGAATKMRKFRDADGRPLWDPSLVAGQPDRFYGRPVYENPAMAAVASASHSVLFGDLSAYYTRIVGAPRVEFSRDYKFGTDQLALRTIIRVDGNIIDTAAIKKLRSANA